MHGRLKVKTTEQQKAAKEKERAKKLIIFQAATKFAFSKRKNRQYDNEALKVTTDILSANPDFYSLWNFRKEILLDYMIKRSKDEMLSVFKDDLSFTEMCLRQNPKSYGAWHHRCWVMKTTPKPDWKHELKLCNQYLQLDERNFHCWDYRRFIVKESEISAVDELTFSTEKITTNFSNYSSWHYRSKLLPIVHPGVSHGASIEESKLLEEFETVQNAAFTDPNDQSAWFYHRWLLGRKECPAEFKSFIAFRKPLRIIVSFTKPVTVNEKQPMKLILNDKETFVTWNPSDRSNCYGFSHMWIAEIDDASSLQSLEGDLNVRIEYDNKFLISCILNSSSHQCVKEGFSHSSDLFRSEFGSSTCLFLKAELQSCQQLQELEPDNKWTLLTSVLLMKAIDAHAYESTMIEYFDKLAVIDYFRKAYYQDLKSRFIAENVIEKKDLEDKSINISGYGLSSLYHSNYLVDITHLDLRNNRLTRLNGAFNLLCLKVLLLDDNKFVKTTGLEDIPNLETISMRNNKIEEEVAIKSLYSCNSLKNIDLRENPICVRVKHISDVIRAKIPSIVCINMDV